MAGMGGVKKGRGMPDDGGLHLFLVPEPPPLGEEGDVHGRVAVTHQTLTHNPTSLLRQYRRQWYCAWVGRCGDGTSAAWVPSIRTISARANGARYPAHLAQVQRGRERCALT